jgi:WD40 repeat protein
LADAARLVQLDSWGLGRINAAAWMPDGREIAAAGSTGLFFYNARSGQLITTLGAGQWFSDIAVSPAGDLIAVSHENTLEVWSRSGSELLFSTSEHGDLITDLAFSPDGSLLVTATGALEGFVRLWAISTGETVLTLSGHTKGALALAYSPDGLWLAVGDGAGSIWIWQTADQALMTILTGHSTAITSLAFDSTSQFLVSGGDGIDNAIRLWDVARTRSLLSFVGHTEAIVDLAFHAESSVVASVAADQTMRLWHAETGFLINVMQSHPDQPVSLDFSPNADQLISTSSLQIDFWDLDLALSSGDTQAALVDRIGGHTNWISRLGVTVDGRLFAAESFENIVRVWDLSHLIFRDLAPEAAPVEIWGGHADVINTTVFSPVLGDSSVASDFTSASWDTTAALWKLGDVGSQRILSGHQGLVWAAAYDSTGRLLATSSFGEIRIWDTATGLLREQLIGHNSWVTALAFSPDGLYLASASYQEVWIWDAQTGQRITQLSGHPLWIASLAFSPDGAVLATGGGVEDNRIRLFEVPSGRGMHVLEAHQNVVGGMVYSPDGTLLVTADRDGMLWVWDAETGLALTVLSGHVFWVDTVIFSPDGRYLISGGVDGTVRLWGVRVEE